jgi:parvulin-like peptidyl-prolyl isomerase
MTYKNIVYFLKIIPVFVITSSMIPTYLSAETQSYSVSATSYRPLAMVNDSPITPVDIDNRIQFLRLVNRIPDSVQLNDKDKARILDDLIGEKIKAQETKRFDVKIDQNRLDDAFKSAAMSLGISENDFAEKLRSKGLERVYFDNVTNNKLSWDELVRGRYQRDITVSTYEIAQIIESQALTDGVSIVYNQILLPFDGSPKAQTDIQETLNSISERLKKGEDFKTIARLYNPDKIMQTKLLSELNPELAQNLLALQSEQISNPVKVGNNIVVAQFIDKQKGDTSFVNQRMTIKAGRLEYEENSSAQKKQETLQNLNNKADLCKNYDDYIDDVTVFENTRIAELPESLRAVAKAATQGQIRIVREAKDSDYVLTICDIKKPDYYNDVSADIRNKTRNQIFNHKLSLKDAEYYRDLKKSAVITLFQ